MCGGRFLEGLLVERIVIQTRPGLLWLALGRLDATMILSLPPCRFLPFFQLRLLLPVGERNMGLVSFGAGDTLGSSFMKGEVE